MIIVTMFAKSDRWNDVDVRSRSDFDEVIEEKIDELQKDNDGIIDALNRFDHDFADLLTADGEERAKLNAELHSCFKEVAEECLGDEGWLDFQVGITEEELLEALRKLTPVERADFAVKVAAL